MKHLSIWKRSSEINTNFTIWPLCVTRKNLTRTRKNWQGRWIKFSEHAKLIRILNVTCITSLSYSFVTWNCLFSSVLFHTWTRAGRRCILFVRVAHGRVEAILLDVTLAPLLSRAFILRPNKPVSFSCWEVGASNGGNIRVYWLLELGDFRFQAVPFALPFCLSNTHTHTYIFSPPNFPCCF